MPVPLISPTAKLRVLIEPSQIEYDPIVGTRRVGRAKAIKFDQGRATCPDEWWPDLEKHGAYTGVGQPKQIWRADEQERPEAGSQFTRTAMVKSGMSTVMAPAEEVEPLDGWDSLSVKKIEAALEAGTISNLSHAIMYEGKNRKRRMVLRALADAMSRTDAPGEVVQPEDPQPGDIADTFSVEAPDDIG